MAHQITQKNNLTQLIVDNFSDGVLVLNKNLEVELLNTRAEQILNVKRENLVGKNFGDVAEILNLKSVKPLFDNLKSTLSKQQIPFPNDTTVELTYIPITGRGLTNARAMLVLHDITREKRVEQLKTEFVSLVAHQLRTPLSAIKWTFNILMSDNKAFTPEQSQLLGIGYKSNERMIALINELLDITRIEEGKYVYNPELVNLEEIVRTLAKNLRGTAKRQGVEIKVLDSVNPSPMVFVDKEKITLAVQNLLDNAIHYSPQGGDVVVSITRNPSEGAVEMSVNDKGIGIPAKHQKRVFQKFFRATNAVSVHTTGTGLGLYITKNIIEAHGGKIWFESEENKGTTFYLTIPVKNAEK